MKCTKQWQGKKRDSGNWVEEAYTQYSRGKQTYKELECEYNKSARTIRKYFDQYDPCTGEIKVIDKPINLVFDATFFKRELGFLIFRANHRNIYWKQIDGEKVEYLKECLDALEGCGFNFKSFTLDGKRGFLTYLKLRYPEVPIQFCQFHQIAIVRRYNTRNPKTSCGKELNALMEKLTKLDRYSFIKKFTKLQTKYLLFLKEKNEQGKYVHTRLRSAIRSLRTNLLYLFTYKDYPELNIPKTTNSCEGSFGHWKSKVKIHRGITRKRKIKMINYFLENS